MPDYPPLANPDVRAWTGERSYAAGLAYARNEAISHARVEGLELRAHCRGSRPEPYRVAVTLGAHGIAAGDCSCPVGMGGRCKHVAALLLTWITDPEVFIASEPLNRALDRLSREQLVDLLLRLARHSTEIEELLELSLPTPAPVDTAASGTDAPASQPVDTSAIQREVARTLRQSERGMASVAESRAHIQRLLDGANAAVDQGAVASAAPTYQTILETLIEFSDALDDSDADDEDADDDYGRHRYGSRYDEYDEYNDVEVDPALLEMTAECVDQCVEGLRRCLAASDDRALRQPILDALVALYQWVSKASEISMGNAVPSVIVEQATAAERHQIAALVRRAMPTPSSNDDDDAYGDWGVSGTRRRLARFWLDLERDTLDDDGYLEFCREAGLTRELVERLLDRDRVEEAAAVASQASDPGLLPLAAAFTSRGQGDVFAVIVRERARTSVQDVQFLRWLKQYAQAAGRDHVALDYATTLFRRHSTPEGYQELRTLAEPLDRWDSLRMETLAQLEQGKSYAVLTQIHLLEHDVDQALRTVAQLKTNVWSAYGASNLHIQVARAAEPAHPDAAIQLYLEAINGLIAQQGRANYAVAAQHLARVRGVYRQQGRGAEWQALIAELRDKQKRLRALQDELKQAGLFEPEKPPPRQPSATVATDRAGDATKPPTGPTVHLLRADGTI